MKDNNVNSYSSSDGNLTEEELYQSKKGYSIDEIVNSDNVARLMGDEQLNALAARVYKGYRIDKESLGPRENNLREAMKLALQVKEAKNFPWPKSSNIQYPIITNATIQFAARAYSAIITPFGVVKTKVSGNDPDGKIRAIADRVAEYENFDLSEGIIDWESDMDRLLHVLPVMGTCFKKTYFDAIDKKNRSDLIFPLDLIVNNTAPSLERAARVTHALYLYEYEFKEKVAGGLYLDININNDSSVGQDENMHPQIATETSSQDSTDEEPQHLFLEQHCFLDLDNDGIVEPYIVTMHAASEKIVRIVARFTEDDIVLSNEGEIIKINHIQYFTKYDFIPSPDGSFYSLGFGDLLLSLNKSINTLINQLIDAGTLSNTGGGFIGKEIRLKGGSKKFRPSEWKMVEGTADDLRKSIVPLPTPAPSTALFQLLGFLVEGARETASIKDVLSGEASGANQSPTTTLALIDQGLKVFTAIYQRLHRSLRKELQKLHKLNEMFIDLKEPSYEEVVNDPEASSEDFERNDFNIIPVSDQSTVTDMQKAARSQFLLQFAADPIFDKTEIYRRVLESANIDNIDKLFVPPAPPQPDPVIELESKKLALEGMKLENDREDLEIKRQKTDADVAKTKTDAIYNLARAESEVIGTQYDIHRDNLKSIEEEVNEQNVDQTRIPEMERPGGNQVSDGGA